MKKKLLLCLTAVALIVTAALSLTACGEDARLFSPYSDNPRIKMSMDYLSKQAAALIDESKEAEGDEKYKLVIDSARIMIVLGRGEFGFSKEILDDYFSTALKAVAKKEADGGISAGDLGHVILASLSYNYPLKNDDFDMLSKYCNAEYLMNDGSIYYIYPALSVLNSIESVRDLKTGESLYPVDDALQKKLIDALIGMRNDSGAWGYVSDGVAYDDADTTAMVLQAIAPYAAVDGENAEYKLNYKVSGVDAESVKTAVEGGLDYLKTCLSDNAAIATWGSDNVYSTAQAVIAVSELYISVSKDSEWTKNGKSMIDFILSLQNTDEYAGSDWETTENGKIGDDLMATTQGTQALIAWQRIEVYRNSYNNMGIESINK